MSVLLRGICRGISILSPCVEIVCKVAVILEVGIQMGFAQKATGTKACIRVPDHKPFYTLTSIVSLRNNEGLYIARVATLEW